MREIAIASTVDLEYPVEFAGETISKLEMRRLTVNDQLKAAAGSGSDATTEVRMIALSAGVKTEVVEQLDLADYKEAQKVLLGFISRRMPQNSGEPSSSSLASQAGTLKAS